MRLCYLPHAVIKVARPKKPSWRPPSQFTRSFALTRSTEYPPLITSVQTDVPAYKPRAQPNPGAKNIAVVGGGITGLAAAYNLTKALPKARVTLFEAKKNLGGWLDSERVAVDNGEVLFEWGPRTLRTDGIGPGRYTAQLVGRIMQSLGFLH
jgi:NADPH-dependent 2,4-dienoyl-CoA reductase/sulfur reductase-like enzyme